MVWKEETLSSHYSSNSISVVVVSCNEGENLRRTVHCLLASLPADGEIILVDDASTDGSADFLSKGYAGVTVLRPTRRLGVARARNFGAQHANGEVIVFSDAHVETPAGWWRPMQEALEGPSVGAVGPAVSVLGQPGAKGFGMNWSGPDLKVNWLGAQAEITHPVPLLCGCFVAMSRKTVEATGGFDEEMMSYGSEDLELSLRLWLLGYEVLIIPQVEVAHLFRERHPYAVEWKACVYNLLRMVFAHFNADRMARVIKIAAQYQDFSEALALAAESDIWTRRASLSAQRVRDDDWFFRNFGIEC
jgi:GT2 family glycosyltransferase